MDYLLITDDEFGAKVVSESKVVSILNTYYSSNKKVKARLFKLYGVSNPPKEMTIHNGYVTDFFNNFEFSFAVIKGE